MLGSEFTRVQQSENKIARNDLIRELLHGDKLTASERSIQLLDQERMKYNIFSTMTKEIQFEYTIKNNQLMVSS